MKRIGFVAALLIAALGGVFYFSRAVNAQSSQLSVTWVNYSTLIATHNVTDPNVIKATPQTGTYKLATGSASPLKFYLEDGEVNGSCTPFIEIDLLGNATSDEPFKPKDTIRSFKLKKDLPSTNECEEVHKDQGDGVAVNSYDNWQIMFEWKDEALISPVADGNLPQLDGRPGDRRARFNIAKMGDLHKDSADGVFYEKSSGCGAKLEKIDTGDTKADLYIANIHASGSCDDDWMLIGHITLLNPIDQSTNKPASNNQAGTGEVSDSTADSFLVGCDLAIPLLGWIACPVLDGANKVISVLDNAISNELTIDADFYLDESIQNSSGEKYFRSWSIVRYISMTLLVIIALVMIISQALGFEIFDAYSIRKVLPRLVLAVIFISLSWSLSKFAVELSNALGIGVRQIIYAPFTKELGEGISISGISSSAIGFGALAGYLGLGFMGVLSLAFTGFLAVGIAFVVLVFRKLLIILLIIFSPLAIIASILPGTRKAWKLWSDNFFKALMAYPIISGFIAFGRVFAAIADDPHTSPGPIRDQSGSSGLMAQLIVFIAYFGPYFALPLAMRLAGGLVATLGGVANDRSRGLFDRLRKGRQARFDDRRARFKMGGVYSRRNPVGRAMNRAGGLIYDTRDQSTILASKIPGIRAIPGMSEQASMVVGKVDAAKHKQSMEALKHVNEYFGDNDKTYRAIGGMYDGYSNDTKRRLIEQGWATGTINDDGEVTSIRANRKLTSYNDFTRFADVLAQSDQETEKKAAVALRAGGGYLSRMHTKQETNYADTAMIGMLGLASHGFLNGADIEAAGSIMTREGGLEYAHAGAVQAELLAASKGHNEAKPGYGHYIDESGHIRDGLGATSDRGFAYLGVMDYQALSNFKGDVLKDNRLGGVIKDTLDLNDPDFSKAQAVVKKWQSQHVSQEQINERIKAAQKAFPGLKAMLFQADSRYFGGSADVKKQVVEIINEAGLREESDRVNYVREEIEGEGAIAARQGVEAARAREAAAEEARRQGEQNQP